LTIEVGLEISDKKTRLTHTSSRFDFLGFNIRQYKVGKHKSGKSRNGNRLGFKTLIMPSKDKVKKHYKKIADGSMRCTHEKGQIIEEPDEVNVTSPVL